MEKSIVKEMDDELKITMKKKICSLERVCKESNKYEPLKCKDYEKCIAYQMYVDGFI